MASVIDFPASERVTVCGQAIAHATHICAFFDSREQELECLVPYFQEGLQQGEQIVTIRDRAQLDNHRWELESRMAVPLGDAIERDQFRLVASEDTYLEHGIFGAERMGLMLEAVLRAAEASPFRRVRTCGDMTWALRDMPGTDELMEYESKVNVFTREHDCTLMCAYDVNQFSGKAVMDVLATHPMVVMGDRIYENPYYVPPESFLQTLLWRGSSPLRRAVEA
ncbi:MAG TPA: MEDS domain-containing protein [Usitatibacter sp.]|jgi:hypothetical protein|nr:MEDS domain-containing protein [Usitatibacter sp.]